MGASFIRPERRPLKPVLKVVEVLMEEQILAIEYHNYLHGFLANRGTEATTIDVKLVQQLAFQQQEAWQTCQSTHQSTGHGSHDVHPGED